MTKRQKFQFHKFFILFYLRLSYFTWNEDGVNLQSDKIYEDLMGISVFTKDINQKGFKLI